MEFIKAAKLVFDYITKDEEENEEIMADKTVWKPLITPLPEDAPPRIRVDWQELAEINDDLEAWILIPAVEISYPVLQGDDNEYYLHRGINQEYLFAGSIFMDAYNNPSFYNYNTIIYGHNMRDGSMFAKLKEFSDEDTLRQCPYFWILTPDADYRALNISRATYYRRKQKGIQYAGYFFYEAVLPDMEGLI